MLILQIVPVGHGPIASRATSGKQTVRFEHVGLNFASCGSDRPDTGGRGARTDDRLPD